MDLTLTLQKGCGYWDLTHHPVGGDFRRATEPLPLILVKIYDRTPETRGTSATCRTLDDNRQVAVDLRHTDYKTGE